MRKSHEAKAYKYDGWPLSEREFAFAEAVVVHVLGAAASPPSRMTDGQIAAIASHRHPEVQWEPQQMEREKRKFSTAIIRQTPLYGATSPGPFRDYAEPLRA